MFFLRIKAPITGPRRCRAHTATASGSPPRPAARGRGRGAPPLRLPVEGEGKRGRDGAEGAERGRGEPRGPRGACEGAGPGLRGRAGRRAPAVLTQPRLQALPLRLRHVVGPARPAAPPRLRENRASEPPRRLQAPPRAAHERAPLPRSLPHSRGARCPGGGAERSPPCPSTAPLTRRPRPPRPDPPEPPSSPAQSQPSGHPRGAGSGFYCVEDSTF